MPLNKKSEAQIKTGKRLIIALSIIIPLAVAMLFKIKVEGYDFSFLPPTYATINGITALVLICALVAIKQKKINLHQRLMQTALILSLLFLIGYVLYHITSESTSYEGAYMALYRPLLISHIILSVVVIPLVLFAYFNAWKGDFEKHKKWVRFAYPIWLYVAISGVVVYLMISPYYGK
jgi:putative membrane protein